MNTKSRIGIYGGTFAPPHLGHIHAAKAFSSELSFDRILIIPTYIPPHKQIKFEDNPLDRLEMARLAFCDIENATVSDYEIVQKGKSYTYLTLEHFRREGELTFLCGTDMFLTLDSWVHPEIIFALSRIAFMPRENQTDEIKRRIDFQTDFYRRHYNAKIDFLHSPAVEISSTEIRERTANGLDTSDMLSPGVASYIKEHGLYR